MTRKRRKRPSPDRPGRPAGEATYGPSTRRTEVDMARGAAVLLMVGFHFVFDLAHFGVVLQDFYNDPFWLNLRTLIVTLFVLVSGVSLHLATKAGVDLAKAGRRVALLAGAASLVSLATFVVFPESWVRFGVLHFLALAGLLGLAFVRLPWVVNLALGATIVSIGAFVSHQVFDRPVLHWIGLMTHKPRTEDYVPLLPWFGVVLLGIAAGRLLYPSGAANRLGQLRFRPGLLTFLGRHSLLIYLVHQPVLFGLVWAVAG